jgi:phosphoglycerate dehydrogenase-like enzyme
MTEQPPDVLILRGGAHGISTREYAASLREKLPDDVVVSRATTPEEERAGVRQARVVTGGKIPESLLKEAENLQVFAGSSAGYDHLPLETLASMGVAVTNASGVHGPNIAEHVVGSMLMFARGFRTFWRQQERHEWRTHQSTELFGSCVTVFGLGAIGRTVIDRLSAFEVETIGVRYSPEKRGPTDHELGFEDTAQLNDALARSDYVVLACPLTETTRGIISHDELKTMEPHAVLVNVGRGPLVDIDALVAALQRNAIGGVALDVTDPEPLPPDHPLWELGNAFITPHASGHTPLYYERLADILAGDWDAIESGNLDELDNRVR